ncbi:MAG TPA: TetR/AcrR family transcriptional regulator [Candidatus Bathyarchaeia archaeon]|nr:TetR/AcrR family transcriptional regulator [Candidatus Bathyarchaeia archaeon]
MVKQRRIYIEGNGDEQETRDRILSAARQLMAKKGMKGATTKKIAELAGVNEVTLFRHFTNKNGILMAVMEEMTDTRSLMKEVLEQEYPDIRTMLLSYGRAFYNLMVDRKELLMICILESGEDPEMCDLFARVPITASVVLAEKLAVLTAEGKVREADCQTAGHMFISSLYTAFMILYHTQNKDISIEIEKLLDKSVDILLSGIQK